MRKLLKKVYNFIPFKKEIFNLLKTVWKPASSVYQHLHFKGVINVPVKTGKSFKMMHYGYQVENDIFWTGLTGGWEKNSIITWLKLVEQSQVILDIGANTGVYSLIAKAINKKAEVYAFEPVERVYNKLVYNNKINGFDIHCIDKALSNQDGFADLFDLSEEHEYSASLNSNSGLMVSQNITKVETITLDRFTEDNNIKKIDLIKIDVETFEPQVFEGFQKYIKLFQPSIIVEILTNEIGEKVFALTNDMGYLYFNINEKEGLKKVDKIVKADDYNYLLCTAPIARYLKLPI